jgi:hypothetical protein
MRVAEGELDREPALVEWRDPDFGLLDRLQDLIFQQQSGSVLEVPASNEFCSQ